MQPPYGSLPVLLVAASLGTTACSADPSTEFDLGERSEPIVFGTDNRMEYGALTAPGDIRMADATAALFARSNVSCAGGTCGLETSPFMSGLTEVGFLPLCSEAPYLGQEQGANCTAFLIGPDVFATAGHCLCQKDAGNCNVNTCADTNVVFGFVADASGNEVTSVPAANVYSCIGTPLGIYTDNEDYAVFRVDRVVGGRTPLVVQYSGVAPIGRELLVIGHPAGLPLKFTTTGQIKEDLGINMGSSIDVFDGNSGSPVIAAATQVVDGIHVRRPYYHYVSASGGTCAMPRVCSESTGCSPNFGVSAWGQATRFPHVAAAAKVPLHAALNTTSAFVML